MRVAKFRTALLKIAGILMFLILWELAAWSNLIKRNLFPAPADVWHAGLSYYHSGQLTIDFKCSILRVIPGFFIGAILGLFSGMLTGRNKSLNLLLSPILNFLRALPPVAILPLFIIWFGIDEQAKIFAIAFGSFFPTWLNTNIGASRIPDVYLNNARLLSSSRLQVILRVELPACLPYIIAGLRLSVAMSFIMVFVSELAGANQGIGYTIANSQMDYHIDLMTAALCLLAATAAIGDYLIIRSSNWLFPWLKNMS